MAAGEWERHVFPARVAGYDPRWLDELCLAGEVTWARLTPRPEPEPAVDGRSGPGGSSPGRRGSSTPSPATPLAITALPEAASLLADVRRDLDRGAEVVVARTDPLHLTGELMGGPRTPAIRHRSVHYLDGVPVDPTPVASAG